MMQNMHKQRGAIAVSVVGSLILLALTIIFAGKLVPVYLDNKSVKLLMEKYENDENLVFNSATDVRNRVWKQLRVDGVKSLSGDDAISVVGTRNSFEVDITYQVKIPLAYNIEMLVSFSDQAEIPRR
jgi:uncharacterized protein (UPF0333 family)